MSKIPIIDLTREDQDNLIDLSAESPSAKRMASFSVDFIDLTEEDENTTNKKLRSTSSGQSPSRPLYADDAATSSHDAATSSHAAATSSYDAAATSSYDAAATSNDDAATSNDDAATSSHDAAIEDDVGSEFSEYIPTSPDTPEPNDEQGMKMFQSFLRANPRVYICQGIHGCIPGDITNKNGKDRCDTHIFKMPEGMTMKFVALSSPGAPGKGSYDDLNFYMKILKEIQQKYNDRPLDDPLINKKLTELCSYTNTKMNEDKLSKSGYSLNFNSEAQKQKKQYLTETMHISGEEDKGYCRIVTVNPGEKMLDYAYIQDPDPPKLLKYLDYGKEYKSDEMYILGSPEKTGYYMLRNYNETYLSDLIYFLKLHGVQEVIFINKSCSTFTDYLDFDITRWSECRHHLLGKLARNHVKYGGNKTKKGRPRQTEKRKQKRIRTRPRQKTRTRPRQRTSKR